MIGRPFDDRYEVVGKLGSEGAQESEPQVTPNPFAEEATRILGAGTAGSGGELAAGEPSQASGWPDQPAPIIEPEEQPGRPRRVWPWVLVTFLILALAAAAYVIVSNRNAAAGPHLGTVPEVVGLSEAKAITKIQAAGFDYQIDGRQPSADVEEGDVLRQDTAGGTKLEKGGTVGIWISSGTGQVEVPNVVGLTQAEAAERLGEAGLEVVAKPEVGSDVEVGRVLRQNPEADKKVDAGTTVAITVAAVTNTVKVPPLTGMTQETAVALLKGMSLVADVQKTDSALPGGIVDHQDPASASEVQPGTTVKVFVSNAPAATDRHRAGGRGARPHRSGGESHPGEVPPQGPGHRSGDPGFQARTLHLPGPCGRSGGQDQQRGEYHRRAQAAERPPRRPHRLGPPGTTRQTHTS